MLAVESIVFLALYLVPIWVASGIAYVLTRGCSSWAWFTVLATGYIAAVWGGQSWGLPTAAIVVVTVHAVLGAGLAVALIGVRLAERSTEAQANTGKRGEGASGAEAGSKGES
jgi:O-antigen ligase